jgi:hypothetical protein
MKKLFLSLLLVIVTACTLLQAQDTLPKFLVKNVGNNRIIISWTNTFQNIRQISIQRSFDSLLKYKTILTVLDPTTPQNGYVDTKADNPRMFYRLYILLDKGVYFFSKAQKPLQDTVRKTELVLNTDRIKRIDSPGDSLTIPIPEVPVTNKPIAYIPSRHVYTQKDGYVQINLPEEENLPPGKAAKKYSLKFFDEDDAILFELKDIKTRNFKIDKTNFYHAGWFKFELYEDGKLIEKHKFYLEKDF